MDRLALFFLACVAQVGCQTPYFPLSGQSTRVPPPQTGIIGSGNYYTPTAPPASANSYIPPTYVPGEEITQVGPWRYWESATRRSANTRNAGPSKPAANATPSATSSLIANSTSRQSPTTSSTSNRSTANSQLTRNDRLPWRDPYASRAYANSTPYPSQARNDLPQSVAATTYNDNTAVGSGYIPRPLPRTGPVTPIASVPLRARFPGSYERREVTVVPPLVGYLEDGVRQASANGTWRAPRSNSVQR